MSPGTPHSRATSAVAQIDLAVGAIVEVFSDKPGHAVRFLSLLECALSTTGDTERAIHQIEELTRGMVEHG